MSGNSKSFVFGVAVGIAIYYAYMQTQATRQ
jgi:hypothetical protein